MKTLVFIGESIGCINILRFKGVVTKRVESFGLFLLGNSVGNMKI